MVRSEIQNVKLRFGIIGNIVSGSVDRTKNDCPVYSRCGGCCFRHMSYEEECRYMGTVESQEVKGVNRDSDKIV